MKHNFFIIKDNIRIITICITVPCYLLTRHLAIINNEQLHNKKVARFATEFTHSIPNYI